MSARDWFRLVAVACGVPLIAVGVHLGDPRWLALGWVLHMAGLVNINGVDE